MLKQEFLKALEVRLSGLPKQDIEERLSFYEEIIDDRIEEGYTEEEAVLGIGSVEEIAAQIVADIPISKLAKERLKPQRKLGAWEIVLLVLGSPIWLSLVIAALTVLLSLYVVLWSVIVSVWAIFVSLVACVLGCMAAGIVLSLSGNSAAGIAVVGASIICAGAAIFAFFGCNAATKGIILLTKKIALGVKRCFVRKECI